jgi:TRAP-type C4-dicarboxylate transport system permease small subunit
MIVSELSRIQGGSTPTTAERCSKAIQQRGTSHFASKEGRRPESEKKAGGKMNISLKEKNGTRNRFSVSEIVRIIVKTAYFMGSGLLLIIMFMVTIDVVSRTLLNKPVWGVLEISEFLLAGAVLLGLGYTEFLDGHVKVELIYDRLSPKRQNIMRIFYSLIGIGLYGVITWQSSLLTIDQMRTNLTSDVLKIPAWPFRAFVPVGAFLMLLVLFLKLFKDIQGLRTKGENKCQ